MTAFSNASRIFSGLANEATTGKRMKRESALVKLTIDEPDNVLGPSLMCLGLINDPESEWRVKISTFRILAFATRYEVCLGNKFKSARAVTE